jgi:hypothetical protein
MVDRLLDLADQMVREGSGSSALRRRAVSTAYYAVFHALAKSCASILLPSIGRNSEVGNRRNEAQNLVDEARKAVVRIESLNKQERQTLATLLLFKSRPQ